MSRNPVYAFLLLSLLISGVALGCERVDKDRGLHFPYDRALLAQPTGTDLLTEAPQMSALHSERFFAPSWPFPFMYPAPVAPLYAFFTGFRHPVFVLLDTVAGLAILCAVGFAAALFRLTDLGALRSALIAGGALLLSYPLAFELKQGNMEIFICILVGAGVYLFLRDHYHVAAALFGIAIAMKIFPFVYMGLFLARRRYTPLVTAAVVAVLVNVAALRFLCPDIHVAWHGISAGLAYYQSHVLLRNPPESGFDHSIYAFLRDPYAHFRPAAREAQYLTLLHLYMLVAAIGGLLAYFLRIRFLPVLNQVLCLCVASILLPPCSYDYTLLHLYVPWALLVLFAARMHSRPVPGLLPVFACLAVLTSIQTEFIKYGHTHEGQIKAVTLGVLFYLGMRYPFSYSAEQAAVEREPQRAPDGLQVSMG